MQEKSVRISKGDKTMTTEKTTQMTSRLIVEYKTDEDRQAIKLFRLCCLMNGNKSMREVVLEMVKRYNHYSKKEYAKQLEQV